VLAADPIAACMIPARIVASGMVTSVFKDEFSFVVSLRQEIDGCEEDKPISVRGLLEKGPKWPDPVLRLPSAQGFVSFTGKLFRFEEQPLQPDAQTASRPVVSLDSITYLHVNIGGSTGMVPSAPPSAHLGPSNIAKQKKPPPRYSRGKELALVASTSTAKHVREEIVPEEEEECEELL
jgi:hypothetical protein